MRPKPNKPKAGQESVWDYPRPAVMERCGKHLKVVFQGQVIAETVHGVRVLETSHPPTYYFPASDVNTEILSAAPMRDTLCEWKGKATYYSVELDGKKVDVGAWSYVNTTPPFDEMKGYIGFYAQHMDACYVDDERVEAQAGPYYGGWITEDVVGPFKGGPGTWGW